MLDRVEKVQDEESCSALYRRYLRDYIRCVHQVTHNESLNEYKVRRSMLHSESKLMIPSGTADRGGSEHDDQ